MTHPHLSRRAFAVAATAALAGGPAVLAADPEGTMTSMLGPFYPVEKPADQDFDMTWLKGHKARALGDVIELTGRVLDRHGRPMRDARLEVWQANAAGRYAHANDISTAPLDPNFQGYALLTTGADGAWRLRTIKPAAYDSPIGLRTPHIHFDIQGRAHRLSAQMYFPEEGGLNAKDPLYKELGPGAPTSTAMAAGAGAYSWDVVLMDS